MTQPQGPQWGPVPEGPTPTGQPPKKRKVWLIVLASVVGVFILLVIIGSVVGSSKPAEKADTIPSAVPTTTEPAATTTTEATTATATIAPTTTTTTDAPPTSTLPPAVESAPPVMPQPTRATPTSTEPVVVPPPATVPPKTPAATKVDPPTPTGPYFKSCAEAKKAGFSSMRVGDPGYRPGLDADHDGIACDKVG